VIEHLTIAILALSMLPSGRYPDHMTIAPRDHARELATVLSDAATSHGIDPALLTALAWHESGFEVHAVSRAGAIGLLQLNVRSWGRLPLQLCLIDPRNCAWWNSWHGARAYAHYLGRCGSEGRALVAYRTGRCKAPGPEARKVLATRARIRGEA
jgi:hypothetical protein